MASAPAKPHLAPASLNVRSPLLRKATFFVASFGNNASSRRHSSPVNVARMRSHVSASITSHRWPVVAKTSSRSEEHTSELQSRLHLVCRLLLEKKKSTQI